MADNQNKPSFLDIPPDELERGVPSKPPSFLDISPEALEKQAVDHKLLDVPPEDLERIASIGVDDSYFQRLAKKYSVDPEELRSMAPYWGLRVQPGSVLENLESGAKEAAGTLGRSLGLGIPQFVAKKLQDKPMRYAIDDMRAIAREQAGLVDSVVEAVIGPAGIASSAARGITRLAGAAATGGILSAAESREGKEAQGFVTGAVIGGALGGAAEGIRKLVTRASKAEQRLAADIPEGTSRQMEVDLESGIQRISKETADSENLLEELVLRDPRKGVDLSRDEVSVLLKEQVSPGTLERAIDTGVVSEAALAERVVENRILKLAESLEGSAPKSLDEARAIIASKQAGAEGAQHISNVYKRVVDSERANRAIEEGALRSYKQPGIIGRSTDMLSDNQHVLRGIDEQFRGIRTERALRDINTGANRMSYPAMVAAAKLRDLFNKGRAYGLDSQLISQQGNRVYAALDGSIPTSTLPAEAQRIAEGFRSYFSEFRKFVKGVSSEMGRVDPGVAPLALGKVEHFVPRMLLPTREVIPAIEGKLSEAVSEATRVLQRPVGDLSTLSPKEFALIQKEVPAVAELQKAATLLGGIRPGTAQELTGIVKDLVRNKQNRVRLESTARTVNERTAGEGIPDFLIDKNLFRITDRYTRNTLRHLYLREPLAALANESKKLEKLGADVHARYTRKVVEDILGVRSGTGGALALQAGVEYQRALGRLIDRVGGPNTIPGGVLTAARALPSVFESLARQIYPNLLGFWNVRAVVQNATQTVTKVLPELGVEYGSVVTPQAAVLAVRNFRRLSKKTEQFGSVPAEFIKRGQDAIAEGIQRSALYRIPAGALEGMSRAGMIAYQGMERYNRVLVTGVAELMAGHLTRGGAQGKLAAQAVRRMPPPIRRDISRFLQEGNTPELERVLARHLNDSTQYVYNRASMSEFGRTLGPLFSTFSKWPTATLGDIVQTYRAGGLGKGTLRVMEKYLAPLLLLQGVDYMLGERLDDPESLSDIQKKLVGSYGISQGAPLGSLGAILKGEIFTPPVVDAVTQTLINPILEGKDGTRLQKMEKGAGTTLMNFAPGAGVFRLIFDDLLTYAEGRRPEGASGLERVTEGMRRSGR